MQRGQAVAHDPERDAREVDGDVRSAASAPARGAALVCTVCGGAPREILCTADELAAQRGWLRDFEEARLGDGVRDALAARARLLHHDESDLVLCETCGLVQHASRSSTSVAHAAHESESYPHELLPRLVEAQQPRFRPLASALARRLGARKRVLEVGSFVGGFLEAARAEGLDPVGLEACPQLVMYARSRELRVLGASIEDLAASEEPGSFDAIAIASGFEELPRPASTLWASAHLLRPGGLLALRVPHGACFRALLPRARAGGAVGELARRTLAWSGLLAFPYLHGHELSSLDRLLARHRFSRADARGSLAFPGVGRLAVPARMERAWVERAQRAHIAWTRAREPRVGVAAPWLDVVYALRAR